MRSSAFSSIKAADLKSGLKPVTTRVTSESGRVTLERRDGSAADDDEVRNDTATESVFSRHGFIPLSQPDLQVGCVLPHLLVGSQDAAADYQLLRRYCVTHVVNLAHPAVQPRLPPELPLAYLRLSVLDTDRQEIGPHLPAVADFVDQCRDSGGVCLLHCNAGVSRAPAFAIGYLIGRLGLSYQSAYAQVKAARPAACPNSNFVRQLKLLASEAKATADVGQGQ